MITTDTNATAALKATLVGAAMGATVMGIMIAGFMLTDGRGPGASRTLSQALLVAGFILALFVLSRTFESNAVVDAIILAMTATTGATLGYVLLWEMYLYVTDYAFIEAYIQQRITAIHDQGLTESQQSKALANTDRIRSTLLDPGTRLWTTAREIVPTGCVTTLPGSIALCFFNRRKHR